MRSSRRCSRSACLGAAVATLTYVYSDSTAVVGPLATAAEPHSYDLCEQHAVRLTVPRGWEVLRHVGEFPSPLSQPDDLEALADAVREAARAETMPPGAAGAFAASGGSGRRQPRGVAQPVGRWGHLRVVPAATE